MPTARLNDAAETEDEQGDEWAELVSVQGAIVQAEEALARSTLMQTARLNEAAETDEVQEESEVQDDEDEDEGEYVGLPSFNTEAGRSWVHTRAGGWTFQESQVLILSNPGTLGIGRDVEFSSTRAPLRDRVVVQTERSERQRERLSEITAAREALEAQMEGGEITEGHYLERMNALRDEYGAVLSRVDRT